MKEKNYKKNVKLYRIYKMFSYDLIFYYSIYILFYTMTKKLTISEVMYISATYSFFAFIWQFPINYIVEKIGLKKSLIMGHVLVVIDMIGVIISKKIFQFMFFDVFGALGWGLCGVVESSILYSSLKKLGRKEEFSKHEGKALSLYFYYDAITAILSGFLFVVNNYLPMILCIINVIIGMIIAINFTDIKNENEEEILKLKDIPKQLKKLFHLKRSRSLLLFTLVFAGIIATGKKMYNAILLDMMVLEQYIAVILSFATIFIGLGSKYSNKFENYAKNKTLTVYSITYVVSLLFIGILGFTNYLSLFTLSMYMICLVLICIVTGSYTVAIKRYILNFTSHKIRTRITSLYYFFKYIGEVIFLGISGILLEKNSNSVATIIFSFLAGIVCLICLIYMKGKTGLKAEEYSKEEIYIK